MKVGILNEMHLKVDPGQNINFAFILTLPKCNQMASKHKLLKSDQNVTNLNAYIIIVCSCHYK
jgi:hypothetical protein